MINCPNCKEKIDDTDWLYNKNLFGECDSKEVKCPHCSNPFMISAYETIKYCVCTVERFEEFEEIF